MVHVWIDMNIVCKYVNLQISLKNAIPMMYYDDVAQ